jgi:hypothetical protein
MFNRFNKFEEWLDNEEILHFIFVVRSLNFDFFNDLMVYSF